MLLDTITVSISKFRNIGFKFLVHIMSIPAETINKQHLINFLHENLQVYDWNKIQSGYIIGSFADPEKQVTDDSDLDVMLFWDSVDSYIENQNTYPKGINGTESVRKQDNPEIQTPSHGLRPVDVLEFSPMDNTPVPDNAIRII